MLSAKSYMYVYTTLDIMPKMYSDKENTHIYA